MANGLGFVTLDLQNVSIEIYIVAGSLRDAEVGDGRS